MYDQNGSLQGSKWNFSIFLGVTLRKYPGPAMIQINED